MLSSNSEFFVDCVEIMMKLDWTWPLSFPMRLDRTRLIGSSPALCPPLVPWLLYPEPSRTELDPIPPTMPLSRIDPFYRPFLLLTGDGDDDQREALERREPP